ncbi:MAG TPA: ParA family protein [Stellaceae bacterium]|nr:ParA family protein [Stellaceae bacterium]HEV2300182.1 ParA family protein [Stellaceae bacterium]
MPRQRDPIVIAIINMKGGVGKSTIAALLSRYASRDRNLNVLAVDLDPQANLSQAFMGGNYVNFLKQRRPSIVEIFNGYQPPRGGRAPRPLSPQDVVVTSRLGADTLQLIPSRFDFSDNLISSLRPDPHILARFLGEHFQHKDLIIIDCAPTESVLTRAAYHASALILVPVKPEYFATIGFPLLQQSLTAFRNENRGHQIDVSGVVINNGHYDGGNNGGPEKRRAMNEIRTEANNNGWLIFEHEIPFSRGFPKLMRGDYSYQGNAWQFEYFAKEFLDTLGLP